MIQKVYYSGCSIFKGLLDSETNDYTVDFIRVEKANSYLFSMIFTDKGWNIPCNVTMSG